MTFRPAKTYLLPSLGVTFVLLVCATFAKAIHVALPYQLCAALFQLSAVVSVILVVFATGSAIWHLIQGKDSAGYLGCGSSTKRA